jgi:hypothetical protein
MSISGKMLGARIGGVLLPGVHDYDFDETVDELDGTTAADEGFGNPDTGVRQATIRLTLYFDLADSVTRYTRIRAGTAIADMKLYDDITGDLFAEIPTAEVFQSNKKGQIRDRLMVSATVKTKGRYYVYGA